MTKLFKLNLLAIIAGLLLSACASNSQTAQPTQEPIVPTMQGGYPAPTLSVQGTPEGYPAPQIATAPLTNPGYPAPGTFNLVLADGSEKSMAVDQLNLLPKLKVSFDGTELEVLALADALKQYNIEMYNQVSATGAGLSALILNKDQIAQSYLEIRSDGTFRLAVQGMPQNAWIAGLISLRIE